ncbi:hypothetical protein Tco_0937053 [Tanacetum coccineum]|uniref:DUF4283 domain-containing protein n=1 Tax=Tanacetum coccineum TaxID=301880 RepID=A0ABQ5DF54_9ASTR
MKDLRNASRAKRAAKTHDPLALVENTYASSLSSRSPSAYYVTHPPSVIGYDDDYHRVSIIIVDDHEDSLTTAIALMLCKLLHCHTKPTNKPSSHFQIQEIKQKVSTLDRVDIQAKLLRNSDNLGSKELLEGLRRGNGKRLPPMIASVAPVSSSTGVGFWWVMGVDRIGITRTCCFVDIEGIPLHVWSREMFAKIGNKWGEALDIEDNFGSSFARKRLCILTKQPESILEKFKSDFKKAGVLWHRAKELFT